MDPPQQLIDELLLWELWVQAAREVFLSFLTAGQEPDKEENAGVIYTSLVLSNSSQHCYFPPATQAGPSCCYPMLASAFASASLCSKGLPEQSNPWELGFLGLEEVLKGTEGSTCVSFAGSWMSYIARRSSIWCLSI